MSINNNEQKSLYEYEDSVRLVEPSSDSLIQTQLSDFIVKEQSTFNDF